MAYPFPPDYAKDPEGAIKEWRRSIEEADKVGDWLPTREVTAILDALVAERLRAEDLDNQLIEIGEHET